MCIFLSSFPFLRCPKLLLCDCRNKNDLQRRQIRFLLSHSHLVSRSRRPQRVPSPQWLGGKDGGWGGAPPSSQRSHRGSNPEGQNRLVLFPFNTECTHRDISQISGNAYSTAKKTSRKKCGNYFIFTDLILLIFCIKGMLPLSSDDSNFVSNWCSSEQQPERI